MSITSAVAIYAAIVASAGLLWQVLVYVRSRRRMIEVKLEPQLALRKGFVGKSEPQMELHIQVTAVNHGERTQYVDRVGVRALWQDGGFSQADIVPDPRGLPHGERTSGRIPASRFGDRSPPHYYVGVATLASGEEITSPRESPDMRMEETARDATADPRRTTVGGEQAGDER
jgi:hypothetical protein